MNTFSRSMMIFSVLAMYFFFTCGKRLAYRLANQVHVHPLVRKGNALVLHQLLLIHLALYLLSLQLRLVFDLVNLSGWLRSLTVVLEDVAFTLLVHWRQVLLLVILHLRNYFNILSEALPLFNLPLLLIFSLLLLVLKPKQLQRLVDFT